MSMGSREFALWQAFHAAYPEVLMPFQMPPLAMETKKVFTDFNEFARARRESR